MAFISLPFMLIAVAYASGGVINGGFMRSLRCLGSHSLTTTCRVIDITLLDSERLRQLYLLQTVRVRDALDRGNLTILSEADLLTLHPHLLYLIPVEAISKVGVNKIAALVNKWFNFSPLVQHLFQAAHLVNDTEAFLIRLQGVNLRPKDEDILGRQVASWSRNYGVTTVGDPLLAYLPAPYLYSLTHSQQIKEFHFLKMWLQSSSISSWNEKSDVIKSTWARIMMNVSHPQHLSKWTDSNLSEMGPLLVGLSCKELKNFNPDNFSMKMNIFEFNFTVYQVRCLWETFVSSLQLKNVAAQRFSRLVGKLTPKQISEIPGELPYKKIKPASLSAARQLVQFHEGEMGSVEERLMAAGSLAYSLPNIKVYRYHNLPWEEVLKLQSDELSPAQAFYLSGKGNLVKADDKKLQKFIVALPVVSVPTTLKLDQVYYLLKRVHSKSPLVIVKLLSLLPANYMGNWESLKYILKNPEKVKLLELVPSRTVTKVIKQMNKLLPSAVHLDLQLPAHIGDMLYSFNQSSLLLEYISCQNIESISDIDLPHHLSVINNRLSSNGMNKDVQECWSQKLINYIHLKSSFIQQYLGEEILELLTSADIHAAGGYVLSMLDMKDMVKLSNLGEIVYTIGRLSHRQLLTAAPREKFITLTNAYLKREIGNENVRFKQLYELGNLTLILDGRHISHIKDFKLLLNSNLIDKRVCSNSSNRQLWREVLLSSLGPARLWTAEELLLAGNFMLVLKKEDFEAIPHEAVLEAIDQVLPSLYAEPVPDHFSSHTDYIPRFYQVCTADMDSAEKASYKEALRLLVSFSIRGLRMQLNSVLKIRPTDQEEITTLKTQIPEALMLSRNVENFFTYSPSTETTSSTVNEIPYMIDPIDDDPFSSFGFEEFVPPDEKMPVQNYKQIYQDSVPAASAVKEQFRPADSLNSKPKEFFKEFLKGSFALYTDKLDESAEEVTQLFPDSHSSIHFSNFENISETASKRDVDKSISKTFHLNTHHPHGTSVSQGSSGLQSMSPNQNKFSPITESVMSLSTENVSHMFTESPVFNEHMTGTESSLNTDFKQTNQFRSQKMESYLSDSIKTTLRTSTEDPLQSHTHYFDEISDSSKSSVKNLQHKASVTKFKKPFHQTKPILERDVDLSMTSPTISSMTTRRSNFNFLETSSQTVISPFPNYYSDDVLSSPAEPEFSVKRRGYNLINTNSVHVLTTEEPDTMVSIKSLLVMKNRNGVIKPIKPAYIPAVPDETKLATDFDQALNLTLSRANLNTVNDDFNGSELEDQLFEPVSESSTRFYRQSESHNQEGVFCGTLKSIGVAAEVAIDEDIINSMDSAELDDCSYLLGTMDLPHLLIKQIWKKIPKEDLHLKGNLVSTLTLQDIKHIEMDSHHPWSLEAAYTLSKYNADTEVAEWVVSKIVGQRNSPLSPEALVALGPYLCHVVQSNMRVNWVKGENMLMASRILGQRLHCDRLCLREILSAIKQEDVFGSPSNWTRFDVESLGIIVAGMNENEWSKLLTECPNCISGLTKKAALCLPESHMKIIPDDLMKKVTWNIRKVLEVRGHSLGSAKAEHSISVKHPKKVAASVSPSLRGSLLLPFFAASIVCKMSNI